MSICKRRNERKVYEEADSINQTQAYAGSREMFKVWAHGLFLSLIA